MSLAAIRLNFHLLPLACLALACQDPAAPQTHVSAQYDLTSAGCDLDSDWCGSTDLAGSYRLVMTGFDSDALTITGVNRLGASVTAQLTIGTAFKPTLPPNPIFPTDPTLPPNPVIPTDPLLPPSPIFPNDPIIVGLLSDYDNALSLGFGDGSSVYTAISNLAAARVGARLWIDSSSGVVRAFRPIN